MNESMQGKRLKTIAAKFLLLSAIGLTVFSAKANSGRNGVFFEGQPIEGRWDLTVIKDGKELPSWLEVRHSGFSTLVGYFVAEGGSARPIAKINFKDDRFSFAIPPQWDRSEKDIVVEGLLQSGKLSGTILETDGKTYSWTGVKAPALWREKSPVWDSPIPLFDGTTTRGWHTNGPNQWQVINGVLTNPKAGSNLYTDRSFDDFKLHIEFRYPKGSNSGVYLRGRYEVQIADNIGEEPLSIYFGGIYGFIAPVEMVAKAPGEWQSYDITLIGRLVTVVANGKTIICNQSIPGITGGAINSREAEPGPLFLQGDHGPIEFRNILVTPAK